MSSFRDWVLALPARGRFTIVRWRAVAPRADDDDVEQDLNVAGSNAVSRSTFPLTSTDGGSPCPTPGHRAAAAS